MMMMASFSFSLFDTLRLRTSSQSNITSITSFATTHSKDTISTMISYRQLPYLALLLFICEAWISPSTTVPSFRRSLSRCHESSSSNTGKNKKTPNNIVSYDFPPPSVWNVDYEDLKKTLIPMDRCLQAKETWNWCRNFIVPMQLCPWARKSLETTSALQMYVPSISSNKNPKKEQQTRVVKDVAFAYRDYIQEFPALESTAIFFVIFPGKMMDSSSSFMDFYEWFEQLEDDWDIDEVTVAAFNPDWQFGDDTDETLSLEFEKKSPYPTITLVSTKVIEQAGPAATEQISHQNYDTLTQKSPSELKQLWQESISGSWE
jgi:hypothetical protein